MAGIRRVTEKEIVASDAVDYMLGVANGSVCRVPLGNLFDLAIEDEETEAEYSARLAVRNGHLVLRIDDNAEQGGSV